MHYLFIQMPSGVSELRIRSSEGTGHANLYANLTSWATPSRYHYRSINAGNGESITIPNPPSGWLYISLHAESSFSGVQVSPQRQRTGVMARQGPGPPASLKAAVC